MDVVAFLSGPWAVSSPRRQTPGGGSPEWAGLGRDVREKPGRWRLAASWPRPRRRAAAGGAYKHLKGGGPARVGLVFVLIHDTMSGGGPTRYDNSYF